MLELHRKHFASAIALAAMPIERRNTIPSLATLRCSADDGVEFEGTDLDVTVTARLPSGSPGWKGRFLLPDPAAAGRAVKTVGAETVRFSEDGAELRIETGALTLSAATPRAEDFPWSGSVDAQAWGATLSPEAIATLARVARVMSHEETRYYLNGILLHHVDGWNYRAVATDGHRMSILDIALPDAEGVLPDIIIPRKAVGILLAAAKRSGSPLRIAVGNPAPVNMPSTTDRAPKDGESSRIRFTFDQADGIGATISTKLIDGRFPDYHRVVPSIDHSVKRFQFKAAELRRAVTAISIGSREVRAVKVTLDETGHRAQLSRYVPDAFSGSIGVECQHNAAGFEIGMNGQYLLDVIDCADGEEIAFATADTAAPILIKNPADTLWTGVLMPMRV